MSSLTPMPGQGEFPGMQVRGWAGMLRSTIYSREKIKIKIKITININENRVVISEPRLNQARDRNPSRPNNTVCKYVNIYAHLQSPPLRIDVGVSSLPRITTTSSSPLAQAEELDRRGAEVVVRCYCAVRSYFVQ